MLPLNQVKYGVSVPSSKSVMFAEQTSVSPVKPVLVLTEIFVTTGEVLSMDRPELLWVMVLPLASVTVTVHVMTSLGEETWLFKTHSEPC